MDPDKQRALMAMIAYGVLKIEPPFLGAVTPFKISLDIMEADPSVRGPLLSVLMSEVSGGVMPDAIAAVPSGCRGLACMLADRLKLPYILPVTAMSTEGSPILLYGYAPPAGRILLLQDVLISTESFVRMASALHASGFVVQRVLSIVDAGVGASVPAALGGLYRDAEYRALFKAEEILVELRDNHDFRFMVEPIAVAKALEHFFSTSASKTR